MSEFLNQKERAIRESRTFEATRKNLMGASGKLGVIARYLGSSIILQTNMLSNSRSLDEYLGEHYGLYEDYDSKEIPTFDEYQSFTEVEGYIFDGLSRGMHIEIKYLKNSHTLTVYYKGYTVYMETAGELYSYAPFEEWEEMIDKLYVNAYKKQEEDIKTSRDHELAQIEEAKKGFLQRLRTRWGV